MKKLNIILTSLILAVLFSCNNEKKLISSFQEYLSNRPNTCIDDSILNINTVEATEENYDIFSEGNFDITRAENIYCSEVNLEKYKNVVVFLQHRGSGRFPHFYAYAITDESGKYKQIFNAERDLYPFEYEGKTYFLEIITDFDSKRNIEFKIIDSLFDREKTVYRIIPKYSYVLDEESEKYITGDIINKIAEQDYSFMDKGTKPAEIIVKTKKQIVKGIVKYTSTGYFATTVELGFEKDGEAIDLNWCWGFNVTENDEGAFLAVINWQESLPVSTIEDVELNVINLDTKECILKKNLFAKIDYTVLKK